MKNILVIEKLKKSLEPFLSNGKDLVAAFDADGTLWPHDVGRDFFQYQVKNKLLFSKYPNLEKDFQFLCEKKGRSKGLCWLSQIQAGQTLENLNNNITDFLKQNPVRFFDFQKDLINWFKKYNVKVFIVSSSLKWVLDLALKNFIPSSQIIGVETKVENGIITNEVLFPAPVFAEKVPAFLTKSKAPIFVSGNSMADKALLEISTGKQLVVSSAQKENSIYKSEQDLLSFAKKQNWFWITRK